MIAKKPKNSICPRCGYGMAPRRKGKHCIDCTQAEEKQQSVRLQIKKINITQKKPKLKASRKKQGKTKT